METRTEHDSRRGQPAARPPVTARAVASVAWAALALASAGCGRLSFDPGDKQPPDAGDVPDAPAAALELVTPSTDEVIVRIPGELELAFLLDSQWQPARWIDLAFDPGVNLAGNAEIGTVTDQALFAPLGITVSGQERTLDNAFGQAINTGRLSPTQVQLLTTWKWFTPQADFTVTTSYIIDADGRVDVSVVAVPDRPAVIDAIEYAYATVTPELEWKLEPGADEQLYAVRSALGPRPSGFVVQVETDGVAPGIESAGLTNLHFRDGEPFEVKPELPLSIRWSALFAIGDPR